MPEKEIKISPGEIALNTIKGMEPLMNKDIPMYKKCCDEIENELKQLSNENKSLRDEVDMLKKQLRRHA